MFVCVLAVAYTIQYKHGQDKGDHGNSLLRYHYKHSALEFMNKFHIVRRQIREYDDCYRLHDIIAML